MDKIFASQKHSLLRDFWQTKLEDREKVSDLMKKMVKPVDTEGSRTGVFEKVSHPLVKPVNVPKLTIF